MSRWDAIVVGAGICGLAAAYELARRQQRVLVLERAGVGAGQSAGLARIVDTAAAAVRRQHAGWVPATFRGLDPEPVDELRCVSLAAGWLDETGGGFAAERSGPVIAFGASNAMKFGPLVGVRLAETVLDPDRAVHTDLERRRR